MRTTGSSTSSSQAGGHRRERHHLFRHRSRSEHEIHLSGRGHQQRGQFRIVQCGLRDNSDTAGNAHQRQGDLPITSSSIAMSWTDNANNETGYNILRKATTASNFTQIASLPANTTTYTDTGTEFRDLVRLPHSGVQRCRLLRFQRFHGSHALESVLSGSFNFAPPALDFSAGVTRDSTIRRHLISSATVV